MKALFLAKYGSRAASTRHRFVQFFEGLEAAGIECELSPLLDDAYLDALFAGRRFDRARLLASCFKRIGKILAGHRYDAVVIHCEAFPFMPPTFERLLKLRGIPYMFDLDDAIFHGYDQHPSRLVRFALGGKIGKVMSWATHVQCGCPYLADFARRFNSRVDIVPTVVRESDYAPRAFAAGPRSPITIGWIGSPSTSVYVRQIAEPLRSFCLDTGSRLHLVGSGPFDLGNVPLTVEEWSQETERHALGAIDVGIMPLRDDPWSRGKCGFKLIQYMAAGLPVVASPVGVNSAIVQDGVNGFLPTSPAEWVDTLNRLHHDPGLRYALGQAGRRTVESSYSFSSVLGKLKENLFAVANRGGSAMLRSAA